MSDHLSLYYLAALILVVLQDVVSFNYKIEIKTNKEAFSGYVGRSFIKIFGSAYLKTAEYPLTLEEKDDFFPKDSTKTLTITDATNVEDICGVTIRTADDAKWCIDSVEVKNVYRNKNRRFLFGQCIKKSSMTRFLIVEWTGWSDWSGCEGVYCTNMKQKRIRFCVNCYDNVTCIGPTEEEQNCTTQSCCESCPTLSSATKEEAQLSEVAAGLDVQYVAIIAVGLLVVAGIMFAVGYILGGRQTFGKCCRGDKKEEAVYMDPVVTPGNGGSDPQERTYQHIVEPDEYPYSDGTGVEITGNYQQASEVMEKGEHNYSNLQATPGKSYYQNVIQMQ